MDWFKRREVREHFLGTFYRRYTRDRSYCIVEVKSRYDNDRVLALHVCPDGVEFILWSRGINGDLSPQRKAKSRRRALSAACNICEKANKPKRRRR